MTERLSRKALYDLVWSEPMKTLAPRFAISDVALKKTCDRAEIPTPDRGYWAKKDAGKKTFQVTLPIRPPGMDDELRIAAGSSYWDSWYGDWKEEELRGPLPSPPEFTEPIEAVRERIAREVGEVLVPHKVRNWHGAINRLLKEDEKRREKQLADRYPMSWNNPLFDAPFERRRLRILNSLFFATAKMNGKPSCNRDARQIRISFFHQHLHLALDKPRTSSRRVQATNTSGESNDAKLCLSILKSWGSEEALASWQDDDAQKLESKMTEIAVQVILTAEIEYRESALHQYHWRVQRKAELEEEERQRKIEAERAERERLKRRQQARIDRLMRDAAAFQQAGEIRKYVEAIRLSEAHEGASFSEQVEKWSQWALAEADRIDPSVGRVFLKAMQDE